ncbi:MAG: PAS domain S-box protein, partial [Acidimicrobiales bacterium]
MSDLPGPDTLPATIWVQVAQQSPELALIVDERSCCWFASLTLSRVTGFTEADVIGQPLVDLVHPDDRDRLEQAIRAISLDPREHPVIGLTARVCFAELAWHDLNLRVRRLEHGGQRWYLLTVRDETVRRRAEAALLRRTELDVLLERIQRRFVNATADAVDATLCWALEEVGRFLGADRGYVLAYDLGDRSESMTHEWHSSATEPEIDGYQHVSFDEIPISTVRRLRGEIVAIAETDSLGREWAADRAFMEANGIRSLLELPIVRDGLTVGSVGFDWIEQPATWTTEDLTMLGVLGSTFSQMLARKDAEVALERTVADSQTRFATLLDNIPDPVMRVGPDGEV